jgi:hypothetical protein
MPYKPGQSGNPAGRPKGSGDKVLAAMREPLRAHGPALIDQAIAMAKDGNEAMIKLCIDRVLPVLKSADRCVIIEGIDERPSLLDKAQLITESAMTGRITPAEASTLLTGLSAVCRINEMDELLRRVERLEQQVSTQ